jgi:superfamily II DNA helicase RecQ
VVSGWAINTNKKTMQVELFTIPIKGGEVLLKELNSFLGSKKVLHIEKHFVHDSQGAFWCYAVEYIENQSSKGQNYSQSKTEKVDYKEVLDAESFQRFLSMKEIRKNLAKDEGIPAYAVFTNIELAALSKIPELTLEKMKKVKGVGEGKIKKYGQHFVKDER